MDSTKNPVGCLEKKSAQQFFFFSFPFAYPESNPPTNFGKIRYTFSELKRSTRFPWEFEKKEMYLLQHEQCQNPPSDLFKFKFQWSTNIPTDRGCARVFTVYLKSL